MGAPQLRENVVLVPDLARIELVEHLRDRSRFGGDGAQSLCYLRQLPKDGAMTNRIWTEVITKNEKEDPTRVEIEAAEDNNLCSNSHRSRKKGWSA